MRRKSAPFIDRGFLNSGFEYLLGFVLTDLLDHLLVQRADYLRLKPSLGENWNVVHGVLHKLQKHYVIREERLRW